MRSRGPAFSSSSPATKQLVRSAAPLRRAVPLEQLLRIFAHKGPAALAGRRPVTFDVERSTVEERQDPRIAISGQSADFKSRVARPPQSTAVRSRREVATAPRSPAAVSLRVSHPGP